MEKEISLARWIIEKTDTEKYRSGKITGRKHPEVNGDLLARLGRESLLRQAKELENHPQLCGKITFDWCNLGKDIRKIHYDVDILKELCGMEGMLEPREYQLEKIARVKAWKKQLQGYEWAQKYYDDMLASLEKGNKVTECEDEKVFLCVQGVAKQENFIWERIFSKRILNDSKMFKSKYRERIITILKDYSPYYQEDMSDDELLSMHNIHSYAQTMEWKGAVTYSIDDKFFVNTSIYPYGVVLNAQTLEHAKVCDLSGCRRIMTIENKANYMNMKYQEDTIYIFCHGYFTPKEVKFLKTMYQCIPDDCEILHWGDMDYGGINIFQYIKENVFPEIVPYKMDRVHFEKALENGAGIPIEESTREKLEKKNAGMLQELKELILNSGMIIEQEALAE